MLIVKYNLYYSFMPVQMAVESLKLQCMLGYQFYCRDKQDYGEVTFPKKLRSSSFFLLLQMTSLNLVSFTWQTDEGFVLKLFLTGFTASRLRILRTY